MGAETRRIPLPAPTDISSSALGTSDDLATEISRVTDRTSYSIPEDGSPVTITTKKIRGSKDQSQTSLLIEYFEGSKPGEGGVQARPSVRVRVTPSSSKKSRGKEKDHIQITETGRNRKPSYTRRISLPQSSDDALVPSEISDTSSGRPPVEVEVLQGTSDLSQRDESRYYVPASDVSSMPPDSMLDGSTPAIITPRPRQPSFDRTEDRTVTVNTLRAPDGDRDRSISRERLAQSAMKKIQERQAASRAETSSGKLKSASRRSSGSSAREYVIDESESPKARTRRSRDSDRLGYIEASEVSQLSTSSAPKSTISARSNASSINNPKLLSAVEDAIKRLILPELTSMKEEQARVKEEQTRQSNRMKFDDYSFDSKAPAGSRDISRRVSKSSSSPNIGKPGIVADDRGVIEVADSIKSRKSRRSSRGSEKSHETAIREETSRRSSREKKHSSSAKTAAAAAIAGGALTAAALRHHDSITSLSEERERRKKRSKSKSRSRSASITESYDERTTEKTKDTLGIPPMPILHQESDLGTNLTRDSIQSVETDRPHSPIESLNEVKKHEIKTVSTGSPRQILTPEPRTPTRTPERLLGGSPVSIRSDGSAGRVRKAVEDITMAQHDRVHALKSGESSSSLRKARKHRSNLSMDSVETSPVHEVNGRQRPQGFSLEHSREILPEDPYSPGSPAGDNWFEREHEKNERLRREYERESEIGSNGRHYEDESYLDGTNDKSFDLKHDLRDGAAGNAEYVHTPAAVESAVASLHEPSLLSSIHSSAKTDSLHEGYGHDGTVSRDQNSLQHGSSKERWEAIRDQAIANARQQAGTVSPRQSEPSLDGHPIMGASAMPVAHDQHPEIGYGYDNESEVTTNPSIIKGPIGGLEHGNRDHWPYDPTPAVGPNRDSNAHEDHTARDAALAVGAGAAAVGLGLAASRSRESNKSAADVSNRQQPYVDDVQDEHWRDEHHVPEPAIAQQQYGYASPSGGRGIDEGYMSGAVPGGEPTPDPYVAQNRAFDNASLDDVEEDDPFTSQKRLRYASGLSHGMASPLYDATTGKGIDRIKDRDVVALMDHLTVRDAQRNARDTEILVTLVRTAAEMRNQWEDMKKFLQEQDRAVMAHTDRTADKTVQRVLGGPRPFPGAATTKGPRRSTSEETDDSTKAKKNLFRRAFKSLGSKNQDLTKIEGMLMQLLDEVEDLKITQGLPASGSQQAPQDHSRSNSMGSYDNLRTVQDPGYEPEGTAGTSSSPAQSGHLSNQSSKHMGAMHSGYDARRSSDGHRISTVLEGDEEDEDWTPQSAPAREAQYLNNDGMLTPTQEVRRHNSMPLDGSPVNQRGMQNSRSAEETPRTGERKSKHKSGGSWLSGKIPQISRWSKTTASTTQDPPSANRRTVERPYSQMSQSGEDLPLDEYDEYNLNEDDRLRSRTSLDNENVRQPRRGSAPPRSPSPLIPDERRSIEDPKYQAHRNSLNLQHPQPRAGPTHRHQTNLENQVDDYDYTGPTNSELSEMGAHDQWGNTPALALNRLNRFSGSSGQTAHTATTTRRDDLSPVQSEDSHTWSEHSASEQAHNRLPTQQAPARPPKIKSDEGPLVPPKVPFDDEKPSATMSGPGEIGFGYHSPYSNSGMHIASPLEPIEEVRYSLETDRSSVALRNRVSDPSHRLHSKRSTNNRLGLDSFTTSNSYAVGCSQDHGST